MSNEWPLNSKDVGLSKCEKIYFYSVMGPAGLDLKFSTSQELIIWQFYCTNFDG